MMQAAHTLSKDVGKKAACEAFDVPRATFYRQLKQLNRRPVDWNHRWR
jgi:transcriptional regulator of acetoin/glycerol metabolism